MMGKEEGAHGGVSCLSCSCLKQCLVAWATCLLEEEPLYLPGEERRQHEKRPCERQPVLEGKEWEGEWRIVLFALSLYLLCSLIFSASVHYRLFFAWQPSTL